MAVGLPKGPSYPGHSPSFFAVLPPERPQKGSTQLLRNRSPVFSFSFFLPFSHPSSSPHSSPLDEGQRLSQPWPHLSLLCLLWKCNLQYRTCFKWIHLRCSQLSLSKFRALGSSHCWSCPLCRNIVNPSSDSSDMYTSTVQSGPSLLMLLSRPTLVSKPLIPHLPILYLLLCPLTTVPCS